MVELIKKTLLAGVGLAALSKEKAEELAREIASATQTTGEKGKEFVDEVVARSARARKDLEETVQRYVTEQLKRLNLPTKDDIAALNARIEELERTLAGKPQ